MKRILPLTLFFIFLILAQTGTAFAASDDAFIFTMGEEKFAVSQQELSLWKGKQIMEAANILNPKPEPLKASLLQYVGKKTAVGSQPRVYSYKLPAVYSYIGNLASTTINIPVIEPKLKIEGNRAIEFSPPQTGRQTNIYKSAMDALDALEKNNASVELAVSLVNPKQNLSDTNSLGIKELIARGVSNFSGSPKNRRHNIRVGVEKFKGLIIAQGEEFSFNNYLGPVEKENGFLPELVIKRTGTVPELGGGLCQVSSTTFRAAMDAGLPITARRNHAYAVQYYSPQGTDATIYPGIQDLKFINDTPGAILVWPHFEEKDTLIYDFYGIKDGRKVVLDKPNVYDRKTDGSMKATWTRHIVSAQGVEKTDVFKSIYASPALYHKTEEFVTAAPGTLPPGLPPPVLAPPTGIN